MCVLVMRLLLDDDDVDDDDDEDAASMDTYKALFCSLCRSAPTSASCTASI